MRKIVFILILIITNTYLSAQDIYWATKVDSVSSEYSNEEGAAVNILGVPNVDRRGRWSSYAWAVEPNRINTEGVETAYIDVSFGESKKGIEAQQIAIFESFNPGAISKVLIRTEQGWKRVYLDTAVMSRSGFVSFEDQTDNMIDDKMDSVKNKLLTVKKDWNIFSKDEVFQSINGYNILNINFEEVEEVLSVRIVLNLLTIDGWNQIDAVALRNDTIPVDYQSIILADQSLVTDRKSKNLGNAINTAYSEINPVIDPSSKELYFSRSFYDKSYYEETQQIFVSDYITKASPECYKRNDIMWEDNEVWQRSAPFHKDFNNAIPNEIFAFAGDGKTMYLNNLYTRVNKDNSDSIFTKNTSGISSSIKDTIFWKDANEEDLDKLKKFIFEETKYVKINKDKTVLLMVTEDTTTNELSLHANVKIQQQWFDSPLLLGSLSEQTDFQLNYNAQLESVHYLFYADTSKTDTLELANILWAAPKEVEIQNFKNTSRYISSYITPDEKVMFLALENDSSLGKRDLYVSTKNEDGNWTEPKNLGKTINTLNDEASPFLDDDGVSLYFASAGHNGYGEMDIYVTRKTGDDWTKWSKPRNLGKKINTGGEENHFIIDPNTRIAYFSSTTKAFGCNNNSDLFEAQMSKAVTIVFKGQTLDVDRDREVGEVEVTVKALYENGEETFGYTQLVSDLYNGNFSVKINELLDANKLSKFAFFAKKEGYQQTSERGDTISFEVADFNTSGREIVVERNLYLRTDKNIEKRPVVIEETDDDEPEEPKPGPDIVDPETIAKKDEVVTPGKINILRPLGNGCEVLLHRGNMYLVPPSNANNDLTTIEYIQESYFKKFDYNQFDFSVNEAQFGELMKGLERDYNAYGKVTVHLVASASRVPTNVYTSNQDLAEKRATEAIKRIKRTLKTKNIPESKVMFEEHTLVQGPKYANDANDPEKDYKQYQYIKIWLVACKEGKEE